MYKGMNAVSLGHQMVGIDITFKTITGYTQNYDTDEPQPTVVDVPLRVYKRDLSKKERVIMETSYDVNKMLVIHFKQDQSINQEDFFQFDGENYTFVQNELNLSQNVFLATYEDRMTP